MKNFKTWQKNLLSIVWVVVCGCSRPDNFVSREMDVPMDNQEIRVPSLNQDHSSLEVPLIPPPEPQPQAQAQVQVQPQPQPQPLPSLPTAPSNCANPERGIMIVANDRVNGYLSKLQYPELLVSQAYRTCHAWRCDNTFGDQGSCDNSPYYAKVRLPTCGEILPSGLKSAPNVPTYDWMTTREWMNGNYLWTTKNNRTTGGNYYHRAQNAAFRPIVMLNRTAIVNPMGIVMPSNLGTGRYLNSLPSGTAVTYSGVQWLVLQLSDDSTQIILETTTESRPFNACQYDSGQVP